MLGNSARRSILLAAVMSVGISGVSAVADVVVERINPANGHSYKLLATPNGWGGYDGISWADAQAQAQALGGNLATINNAPEDRWVANTFRPFRDALWIGFSDAASEGNWNWANGQPVTYTNWGAGEPNGGTNENYGVLYPQSAVHWNDVNEWPSPFGVAEIEAPFTRYDWKSPGGGNFVNAANWNPAAQPTASDGAYFYLNSAYRVNFASSVGTRLVAVERGTVTFDLGGSAYTVSEAFVGTIAGQAPSLRVESGTFASNYGTIGMEVGVTGTVTVASGGVWDNSAELSVGTRGQGNLNVIEGGRLTSFRAYVGDRAGAAGSVVVDGAGSAWTSTSELYVGHEGTGTFEIRNGGSVAAQVIRLGNNSSGSGQLIISGANSRLSSLPQAGPLRIGNWGQGSATVSGGAVVNWDAWTGVGDELGGVGQLTVSGPGTAWNTRWLNVGANGQGSVLIENGGLVRSGGVQIGVWWPGNGQVTVAGAGSTLALDYGEWLTLGGDWGSQGSLVVRDGGALDMSKGGNIVIGNSSFAVGQLLLTDPGSRLIGRNEIFVGNAGSGSLQVANGAQITGEGTLVVGAQPGSFGAVSVSGASSSIARTGEVTVGRWGQGTLAVSDGGALSSPGRWLHIGLEQGSIGTVDVAGSGSTIKDFAGMHIGLRGQGTLSIRDGATVSAQAAPSIGNETGASGSLTVSGPGSAFSASEGQLLVGRFGSGSLSVLDGGRVSVNNDAFIANEIGSAGQVQVSDPGSSLSVSNGSLWIGEWSSGSLSVLNGGRVSVNNEAAIARQRGSAGQVLVSGRGSTFSINGGLSVGHNGNGSLTIENGGVVSNQWGRIGHTDPGAIGSVLVTGDGSEWINAGDLSIGELGQGIVEVRDGGHVSTVGHTQIGVNDGASGHLLVTGAGSRYTVTNGVINTWRGSVSVADGGTIEIADNYLYVTNQGSFTIAGGTLNAAEGLWINGNNAVVSGYGTVAGRVFGGGGALLKVSGGKLLAGDPQRTNGFEIDHAVSILSDSTLETLDADRAIIGGPITLDNGVIIARNGLESHQGISGYGIIVGSTNQFISAPSGRVNMTQSLDVGSSVARVYSAGVADLGTLTTLGGGTLSAPNGVALSQDDVLAGHGSVLANVALDNGVIAASSGQVLTIAGSLSGHGVLVGSVNAFANQLTNPTGSVALSSSLDIGDRTARVYSTTAASLGPNTTLAGGTLIAPRGLSVSAGQAISGHGTVSADVALTGGMLSATPGQTLSVSGALSGFGLLGNSVQATTMAPASATFRFPETAVLGADAVLVYSAGPAAIAGVLNLAGTRLSAPNGLAVAPGGALRGFGFIDAPITNSGAIAASGGTLVFQKQLVSSGQPIGGSAIAFAATGSFVGSGSIEADVSSEPGSRITATGPLDLGKADFSGSVWLNGALDVGSHSVALRAAGPAYLFGFSKTTLTGGRLSAPQGLTNYGVLAGHGTLDVPGRFGNFAQATFSGVTDVLGPVSNAAGAKITVTGGGPTTFYEALTNDGEIQVSQSSFAVFLGAVTNHGTFTGAGTKVFEAGVSDVGMLATSGSTIVRQSATLVAKAIREEALSIDGVVALAPAQEGGDISVVNALDIRSGGRLDLADNGLIVPGGDLAALTAQIRSAYANGAWTGPGLTSSAAAANPSMGLAIIRNARGGGRALYSTFAGQSVDADAILIAYGLNGDTDLNGLIDADDYFRISRGLARGLGGYSNGDLDYNDTVDLGDYALIDRAFLAQPAGRMVARATAVQAVPEPGVLILLAAGMGLLPLRRRRR